jgi:hypothetical protein
MGAAAFPLAPKFKNPGCPGWVSQVFVDRLIRERRYDDVDAALIQPHATLSAWVRATHRVRTWIDWVTGRLSLSLKPYDTWGMAYLAGVVSDYERRYLKSCLISSQSYSGLRRKRLEVGFYMSQHHPAMYSTIKVGA